MLGDTLTEFGPRALNWFEFSKGEASKDLELRWTVSAGTLVDKCNMFFVGREPFKKFCPAAGRTFGL